MEPLRQHSITFTFQQSLRSSIINWVKQAQSFISSNSESLVYRSSRQKDFIESLEIPKIFHLEQVLESTTIDLATALISILGHPIASFRMNAAVLMTQLASVLDGKFSCNDPKVENVAGSFLEDNNGKIYLFVMIRLL